MIQNIDIKKFPTLKSPPNGACCLLRKECIEEVGLYDQAFDRQDGIDLFYKIISKYDLANVNLPLFYYRQHSSILTKDDKKLLKTRNRILKNVIMYLRTPIVEKKRLFVTYYMTLLIVD